MGPFVRTAGHNPTLALSLLDSDADLLGTEIEIAANAT